MWSLPLQQARFPDFRLKRIASRPSQSLSEISDVDGGYAIAGTQWREPSGHFTQLPLSPSTGTCDGPTRRRRVELAIALVAKNRLSYDEATLYARACTRVKVRFGFGSALIPLRKLCVPLRLCGG